LEIDNMPQGPSYKEISIQVTYFKDITDAPTVIVQGGTYVDGQTVLVEHVSTGGDWFLEQSTWRLEPSPNHERVVISSNVSWGSIIDQIVVDTRYSGCLVALDDLSYFVDQWLASGSGLEADLDGDNDVDFGDYAVLAALWLRPCPTGWAWP